MQVHVVDGTYELFRAYYGAPGAKHGGIEVGATRALLRSFAALVAEDGVTHVAVAFDTVIESFRNELFDGYKTGDGIEPDLLAQFPLAERATKALGIVCWSMIEFEADDALATAAARFGEDRRVERVVVCSPDKDLMQCVRGARIVSFDRRQQIRYDEAAVIEKMGVPPRSIPDYLGLVGDTSDGIPGVPRWGAKSAAKVLAKFGSIEAIPDDAGKWGLPVRGKDALAASLASHRKEAALYKKLATLRTDANVDEKLEDLEWRGADRAALGALCEEIGERRVMERVRFR